MVLDRYIYVYVVKFCERDLFILQGSCDDDVLIRINRIFTMVI